MSKQLTFSAGLSVLATVAMAIAMHGARPAGDSRQATAHGSIVSVLLRA